MVDTVDMEDMDTMERDLLKLKLSQDTSEEDMEAMVMAVDMVVMVTAVGTMARERLKLMLSQATFPEDMDTEVMVATDMDVDTMARGRLKLSQDILEDMVVMVREAEMVVMDMDVD